MPSLTESLFQLGCGDRLVAVTDYCVHPAGPVSALPRVGGTKNPDLARIRSALPDLILASREENAREAVETLQAEGFRVWVTFPTTVGGVLELLWALVRAFDVPHMAPTVDALERACEVQVLAMSTGKPLMLIDDDKAHALRTGFKTRHENAVLHLDAVKEILDEEEPAYAS